MAVYSEVAPSMSAFFLRFKATYLANMRGYPNFLCGFQKALCSWGHVPKFFTENVIMPEMERGQVLHENF